MKEAYSIGIIGGADGPTAILLAGRFTWEILILAALSIGILIWFKKRKK